MVFKAVERLGTWWIICIPASLRKASFILSSGNNKHEKPGVKWNAFHIVTGKQFTVPDESWFHVWTTVIISKKEVVLLLSR